jgi:hypothetical protein
MKTSRIKSVLLLSALLFACIDSYAQVWTPTAPDILFTNPPNTRVGIGTSAPSELLHLSGGKMLIDNITTDYWTMSQWKPAIVTPYAYAWRTNVPCAFSKYLGYGIDYFGWHWITSISTGAGDVAVNPMELLLASDGPLKARLDITGRMRLSDGVIQRGGVPITATSDLGLYSLDPNPTNQIRIVTDRQPIRFYTDANINPIGAAARVTIESTGNVGIGSVIPTEKLDVLGNIRINSNILYLKGAGDNYHGLGYNGLGSNPPIDGPVLFGWKGGALGSTNTTPGPRIALVWDEYGKVGIGTIHMPDNNYKLYVTGGIRTEKVKVDVASVNGWADYVFDKEYSLMPLSELKNFINVNKHLPEIPCAEDVVSNGVELNEMQVKLLKKIEELTLYTIEQDKRIEMLEKRISEIK